MIRLLFDNPSFYAKIVCMLRKIDGKNPAGSGDSAATFRDMSTMVLEVQGGTHDSSTSALDENITVGTKNLFGGDTDYPWSPNISVGKKGIIITPLNTNSGRIYSYDIHVELMTSRGGKLKTIKNNIGLWPSSNQNLDLDNGEEIATFTY